MGEHVLKAYCRQQKVVALSSAEAELYAMVAASAETLAMAAYAKALGLSLECELFCDSSAALGIAQRILVGFEASSSCFLDILKLPELLSMFETTLLHHVRTLLDSLWPPQNLFLLLPNFGHSTLRAKLQMGKTFLKNQVQYFFGRTLLEASPKTGKNVRDPLGAGGMRVYCH